MIDCLALDAAATSASLDADPARRIMWLSVLLTVPLVAVAVRLADLQGRLQPSFVEVFSQTRIVEEELPARNGRILAADGSVLADEIASFDLLVHYRWLEQPADPQWLKRRAWSRLSRTERRQRALVEAEVAQVLARRDQMWQDLSLLTSLDVEELENSRCTTQDRVQHIWWTVNERRLERRPRDPSGVGVVDDAMMPRSDRGTYFLSLWQNLLAELTRPPARTVDEPLVIREQEEFHPLFTNVSRDVAAEIEAHPQRYPGVRVAVRHQRVYPQRDLAVHVLGGRTATDAESTSAASLGHSGLERQYDAILRGRRGRQQITWNRHGEIVRSEIVEPPRHGRDVVLTLDPQLQRRAEQLLDAALAQAPATPPADDETADAAQNATAPPQGGCLVALDVHTGAVLVAAAAPRFDANWLIAPEPIGWQAAAADPRKPFFPRVTQMALPPGSVFKVATAVALLESGAYEPHTAIHCQGYLDRPDQYRCLTFRHYGFGHGSVDLGDALCRSCNVYFFTGARRAGEDQLVEWAKKLGIGRPTGIDLPGETGGHLPTPMRAGSVSDRSDVMNARRWYPGDTLGLAIGQSSLTVTPLQMARLMAAIANDGALVTPHLVASGGPVTIDSATTAMEARPVFAHPEPIAIPGLSTETLAAIRAGMYRVVQDPHGTGYHSVRLSEVAIAGKTGTAEVGGGRPDHAWFAGYVPADRPRVAFAVVLEHGGSGGKVAGPVAREFVKSLLELGLLTADAGLAVSHARPHEQ